MRNIQSIFNKLSENRISRNLPILSAEQENGFKSISPKGNVLHLDDSGFSFTGALQSFQAKNQ